MSKSDGRESDEWVNAVEVMDKIIIYVITLTLLIPLFYVIVTGINLVPDANAGSAYTIGILITIGFVAIFYASITRYRQGRDEAIQAKKNKK